MELEYLGHSCFRITHNGFTIVIDPFKNVRGYNDVKTTADMVLCSHDHFDHNAVDGVKRKRSFAQNPFAVTMMQTYHDEKHGEERGENLVHIISCEGKTIVHLGDLGHMLSPKQLSYVKNCHCLMIPIGGTYTINSAQAWQLINEINPDIAIPMHYKNGKFGFENLENLSDFLTASNRKIAVSTSKIFTLPEEKNLLLVPAVAQ